MLAIEPLIAADDREWCARLMVSNEPWITLKRDYASCFAVLGNSSKERYIVRDEGLRAGFLILDMTGPFPGYIQTICLAHAFRRRGLGSQVLAWAVERILRESPNVFICVSSFNPDARRLYERLGFEPVGTLKNYVVDGHDELLMRKHVASLDSFKSQRPSDR